MNNQNNPSNDPRPGVYVNGEYFTVSQNTPSSASFKSSPHNVGQPQENQRIPSQRDLETEQLPITVTDEEDPGFETDEEQEQLPHTDEEQGSEADEEQTADDADDMTDDEAEAEDDDIATGEAKNRSSR